MDKTLIFACNSECAAEVAWENAIDPDAYTFVRGAEDVFNRDVASIEMLLCQHRWKPGTRTAYLHVEACIYEYGLTHELGK
jgi:hypothetical protein